MPILNRFIDAQDFGIDGSTYDEAVAELWEGQKQTCWCWYVFPQLKGLGLSDMSEYYGITDLKEAKDFLSHPVLSERLNNAFEITLEIFKRDTVTPEGVFGPVDASKVHASATLFWYASGFYVLYGEVLNVLFDSKPHKPTLTLLSPVLNANN